MQSLSDLVARFKNHPRKKWPQHESVLSRHLQLNRTETLSTRAQLSQLLAAFGSGGTGRRRKVKGVSTWQSTGVTQCDLGDTSVHNELHAYFVPAGAPEPFATCKLATSPTAPCKARYFIMGGGSEPARPFAPTPNDMLLLVREVMGHEGQSVVVETRRQSTWLAWYRKEAAGRVFEQLDLPVIAREFGDLFAIGIPKEDLPLALPAVGSQVRAALLACNKIASRTRAGGAIADPGGAAAAAAAASPPKRDRRSAAAAAAEEEEEEEAKGEEEDGAAAKRARRTLPDYLRLDFLRRDRPFLVALEYTLCLLSRGYHVDEVRYELRRASVWSEVLGRNLDEIGDLSLRLRASAGANVEKARAELLEGQLAQPDEDQFLYEYLSDMESVKTPSIYLSNRTDAMSPPLTFTTGGTPMGRGSRLGTS